jgi:hypothetical protein
MKKILSSVFIVGILSISLSANEFEDSMKYVDKALTKLITENKNMKSDVKDLKLAETGKKNRTNLQRNSQPIRPPKTYTA